MASRELIQICAYVGTFVLLVLAFVGWRRLRMELSARRNRFGVLSIGIISAFWLTIPVLILMHEVFGLRRSAETLATVVGESLIPAMVVAALLAGALRGLPRVEAAVAACLLILVISFSRVQ